MEQYLQGVVARYGNLTEEERDSLVSFMNTDVGQIVEFILGPEMSNLIGDLKAQAPQQPSPEPMPQEPMMQQPQRRPGLGARV